MTLKGVAYQDDIHRLRRELIEVEVLLDPTLVVFFVFCKMVMSLRWIILSKFIGVPKFALCFAYTVS